MVFNSKNGTEHEAESIPEPLGRLSKEHPPGIFCVYAYGRKLITTDCDDSYPCGVCRIMKQQNYYLKGLTNGKKGFGSWFDPQFYLDGYRNGNPLFRYKIISLSRFIIKNNGAYCQILKNVFF